MDKKIYFATIFLGLFIGLMLQAETTVGNSSISAKKQSDGLYTITIKDPQGLKHFALKSPGNLPYGGDLTDCPRVFVVNNVSPVVVNDFSGEVDADILDCQNHSDELLIPEIGDKKAVIGKHEEEALAPATLTPTPAAVAETAPVAEAPAVVATKEKEVEISYPVSELGGCVNKDECKLYCDEPANMQACINFAESHNLISKKEADDGRKFSRIVTSRGGGPGGCKTRESCEAFCENTDNIETCLAFAENSDLVEAKDIEEMRKIAGLLKSGEKFPGDCKSKSQCEAYCAKPDNMDACLNFAEKAGFIPPEELAMARKVVPLMKAGKTPGGCQSKQACEAYCENPDNMDVCVAFAEQMGFISPEELAIIKKTGGKGPGDCRGKKQCEDFCQAPENQETCFNFAKDNNLISEEDQKKMEEGMKFIREALQDESTDLAQCLSGALGPDNVARVKEGKPLFDRSVENKLKGCFEQFPPKEGGPGGPGGQGVYSGPGGCKSQEECQSYCQEKEHQDECRNFTPPDGGGHGGGGSGGFEPPENNLPPLARCLTDRLGEDGFNKYTNQIRSDQIMRVMNACTQLSGLGGKGDINAACKTRQECQAECAASPKKCKEFNGSTAPYCGTESYWNGSDCAPYPDCKVNPEECAFGSTSSGGTGGGNAGGPGGCTSQAECQTYCQTHYTDPACGGSGGTGGGGGGGTRVAVCDYAPPPQGCAYIPGPSYNSQTQCGLELSCSTTKPPSPTPTPTPTPAPVQSCAPTPSGLVIWLNGESSSGAVGGVSLAPGKVGNAFKFDGSSGYINMGNPANLNFGTGPFSLEAWFNWTGEGAGQVVNNIIRKSNYGPGAGSGYWLRIGQQLEFSVGATTQSDGQTLITAPVSSGAWHHAVATKDSSGNMQLYVDGQSRGIIVRQAANTQSTSDSSFTIGAWDDQRSEFFHGLIDEVTVYNRALSASEIGALFNAGSAGKCTQQSSQRPFESLLSSLLSPALQLLNL